jgi:hypothetical protein
MHSESIFATALPETPQGYAVGHLVVVEIRNDESLAEMLAELTTISLRRWSIDA